MPVVIRSSKEGFRRCGEAHSKNPTTWPDDRFIDDEMKLLLAEPKLSVHIVPEETGKPGTKAKTGTGAKSSTDTGAQVEPEVLEAARQAIANGDKIQSGAPDIKAMEKILDRDVTAGERDQAWEIIQAEGKE